MAVSLAFLACVERGRLESQALLLCRSIRAHAGRWADAPIHTFQPRAGTQISDETLAQLKALDVQHHTDELNRHFADYPIGNKIMVCAQAERSLSDDVLVFLDSDTAMLKEPTAFELTWPTQIALRPVDHKNRGSVGPGDPNDAYWMKMFGICGHSHERFIETAVSGERIRAYYNSGLMVARRSAGVFQKWKENFERLMKANHVPESGMTFIDQLSLAATLNLDEDRIQILDPRYNYPLPKRPLLPPARQFSLEQLIHIHYHRWFHRPGFLSELRPSLDWRGPMYRWLAAQLPLQPTIDDPLRF